MDTLQDAPRSRALLVGALLLAIITGVLIWQNRSLSAKLMEAQSELATLRIVAKSRPVLGVGKPIAGLRAFDEAGTAEPIFVEGDPRDVILIVASPDCGSCENEAPWWNTLIPKADNSRTRVVCVLNHGAPKSIAKFSWLACRVLANPNPTQTPLAELPVVPSILFVNAEGVIKALWLGIPSEADRLEIEQAFAKR